MRNKNWLIVLLHVLGWILFLSLPFMLRPQPTPHHHHGGGPSMHQNNQYGFEYLSLMLNGLLVPVFYLNISYLVPRFLKDKKIWFLLFTQLAIMVGLYLAGRLMLSLVIDSEFVRVPVFFPWVSYMIILLVAFCYCLLKDNMASERLQKEKETEQLKSELSFLRWQISPHFLFNVLNNMVALARIRSEKVEPMLLQLSTLMRYMIYETDERMVLLPREAEYLKSYIALQQMRFGSELELDVAINIPEGNALLIEPMLLIPFVENAFKHGTGLIEHPVIDIDMALEDEKKLFFEVKNKYLPRPEDSKDDTHGVGLANVQRRLNLLYDGKYDLNVRIRDGWFICTLVINLR
ncbi:sensor histidine kinase [Chitinophagaceae bacterium MMS25-I14]